MTEISINNDYKRIKKSYTSNSIGEETLERSLMLFENLPDLIVPEIAARILKKSIRTLYDWNYRGKMRKEKIPPNLFVKIGGGLYLRKDVLFNWMSYRSSSE